MACCSSCGKPPLSAGAGLPRSCLCGTGSFTTVEQSGGGVVGLLGCVADAVRDIGTQLGGRAYEVRLVWSQWTGGARGVGEEFVAREELLTPTPLVAPLTDMSAELKQLGSMEQGSIRVSEISPRYTEAMLQGSLDGKTLPPDTNFWWEISTAQNPGARPVARRFVVSGPPSLNPTKFEWVVRLIRAQDDRLPAPMPRNANTGLLP